MGATRIDAKKTSLTVTSLDWRPGKFFCAFGGIGSESSTMSCSPMAKRLIRTCTANIWTDWRQHSCRRGHLWSTEDELSSIRTTPGHTHLWSRARSSGSSDGRFRITHQVIITCFCPWRTRLVVWSWPQESPVKIGSPSFLPIGKIASIRGALWSWLDLNRVIVTYFMNNRKFNKNTAGLFWQPNIF